MFPQIDVARFSIVVLAAAAVTAAVAATASPALAATAGIVKVVGSTKVQYNAAQGKTNAVKITRSGRVVVIDDKVAVKAGRGCKAVRGDKTKVRCTTTSTTSTIVSLYLGDRNDAATNNGDLRVWFHGGAGNDTLTGGARRDTLNGNQGNDKLYGGGGNDVLSGGYGNDRLHGGAGDDELNGHFGADREYGGSGDDLFHQWGGGPARDDTDVFSGGGGSDTVDYGARSSAITADADGIRGDDGAKGERDTIGTDVEILIGGAGNDRLYGTSHDDTLEGTVGNDVLLGKGGNDRLIGGRGADKLDGGAGNDVFDGDDNRLNIPAYADVIKGGTGDDTVTYDGREKPVTADLDGVARDDGQHGEHDTLGADIENLMGGMKADVLTGNGRANTIDGSYGNDTIRGGGGNDTLTGGDGGKDRLYGDAGDDTIDGGWEDVPLADHLDGGTNGTPLGDTCTKSDADMLVNCERFSLFLADAELRARLLEP